MPSGLNQRFAVPHWYIPSNSSVDFDTLTTSERDPCTLPYYHFSTVFDLDRKAVIDLQASSNKLIVRSGWIQCRRWWWWYVHFRRHWCCFGIGQRAQYERWRRGQPIVVYSIGVRWDYRTRHATDVVGARWEIFTITLPHPILYDSNVEIKDILSAKHLPWLPFHTLSREPKLTLCANLSLILPITLITSLTYPTPPLTTLHLYTWCLNDSRAEEWEWEWPVWVWWILWW